MGEAGERLLKAAKEADAMAKQLMGSISRELAAAEKRGRIAGLREAAKRADRHPCVGLVTVRSIGEVLRETADKLEQSP